jgi:hypothetical protein
MFYVLPVVACLTGQPPVSQFGECIEHHLPLPRITNQIAKVTACHLGGAVRAHGLSRWLCGLASRRCEVPIQLKSGICAKLTVWLQTIVNVTLQTPSHLAEGLPW